MKKEVDNRKPTGQKITIPKTELTTVRTPKYIKIKGYKVRTPQDIKPFHFGDYTAFGDASLNNLQMTKEMLENAKAKDELIILLRINKTDKGNCVAISEKIETVISYRIKTLATAINLEAISKANGAEHQTTEQFMQGELKSDLVGKELEKAYLSSRNSDLICKDIKRLLTIAYEQQNVSTKRLSRTDKAGASKSDK